MPRGSRMVVEVVVVRTGSAACAQQFTGTITEHPPQSLTALKLSPWMQLAARTVDRLYLKGRVQHTPRL